MKKILTLILIASGMFAQAQQNTLLTSAFWQGAPDVNAIKAEIAKGNNPAQFSSNSMDPVVLAINSGAPAASIEYLLTLPGNDVNKITHDSRIYLHWAANRGNAELVESLLKKGSKIDAPDSRGSTPMLFAVNGGQQNTKIYDLFIAYGLDLKKELNQEGANALLLAISNDKEFALTNYFISKGLSLNSTDAAGNNAFSYAVRAGNIDLLKALIQKGVKPNDNAFLMAAAGGGRRGATTSPMEMFNYLETLGLKPTVIGKTGENALHALVRRAGQAELIQYFLDKGVDINQADLEGNTVFMNAAASNRDAALINTLLPRVKNINQANHQGVTALALAVRGNSPEIVRLLIGKGADVGVLDKKGNNLAYYLLESYRPVMAGRQTPAGPVVANAPKPGDFDEVLTLLKEKGLNITSPQKDGSTLYHLAIAKNDIALLNRIQLLGVDVNAKNKEGLTALHKAALVAKDDVLLKYLLSIGAKKEIATNFKETAFDLATENESLSKNKVSVNFLK